MVLGRLETEHSEASPAGRWMSASLMGTQGIRLDPEPRDCLGQDRRQTER